jgi:hypothetical protein
LLRNPESWDNQNNTPYKRQPQQTLTLLVSKTLLTLCIFMRGYSGDMGRAIKPTPFCIILPWVVMYYYYYFRAFSWTPVFKELVVISKLLSCYAYVYFILAEAAEAAKAMIVFICLSCIDGGLTGHRLHVGSLLSALIIKRTFQILIQHVLFSFNPVVCRHLQLFSELALPWYINAVFLNASIMYLVEYSRLKLNRQGVAIGPT